MTFFGPVDPSPMCLPHALAAELQVSSPEFSRVKPAWVRQCMCRTPPRDCVCWAFAFEDGVAHQEHGVSWSRDYVGRQVVVSQSGCHVSLSERWNEDGAEFDLAACTTDSPGTFRVVAADFDMSGSFAAVVRSGPTSSAVEVYPRDGGHMVRRLDDRFLGGRPHAVWIDGQHLLASVVRSPGNDYRQALVDWTTERVLLELPSRGIEVQSLRPDTWVLFGENEFWTVDIRTGAVKTKLSPIVPGLRPSKPSDVLVTHPVPRPDHPGEFVVFYGQTADQEGLSVGSAALVDAERGRLLRFYRTPVCR